jgi:hypothetical protein
VAARVVERLHTHVLGAHDGDRVAQDLVGGVVVGPGDLLQATRHLPGAAPELLGFEPEEGRIDVALLGDPVRIGGVDGEGDRVDLGFTDAHVSRLTGRYKFSQGGR